MSDTKYIYTKTSSYPPPMPTIDKMVEFYIPYCTEKTTEGSCRYIMTYCWDSFMNVLKSETNKPSKYDLTILTWMGRNREMFEEEFYKEILEIYKNRKEL